MVKYQNTDKIRKGALSVIRNSKAELFHFSFPQLTIAQYREQARPQSLFLYFFKIFFYYTTAKT